MNESNIKKANKYFAAANTYQGFKSYFDSVFNPYEYEYIYVLKGGPGTGKSSLMRRIAELFSEKNLDMEEIYCSSDPHSLDGVIISNRDKKVAIIDGTAPHERDAKVPGVKDEIINLADSLDKSWIRAQRKDISAISKEKTQAYKTAYNYLALAGKAAEIINNVCRANFDFLGAKNKAESIIKDIFDSGTFKITTRLISSFNRYGSVILNTPSEQNASVIRVGGNKESRGLFITVLYDLLRNKCYDFIHFPYALDPSISEALYLPTSNVAVVQDEVGETDSNEFLTLTPLDSERIKTASTINDCALNEAQRWFTIASDLHFRLEKIYGEAMNFDVNDRICEELITKIANILEINI